MNKHSLTESENQILDAIADFLSPELKLLVVTGAGISADSGLPTYRGVGGLYNTGETEQGLTIEQLLSGATFRQHPELTWKYLAQIGKACCKATPNRSHEILVEMETHFEDFCILTQNIDGFHRLAGSQNLIEIHGNLNALRCEACHHQKRVNSFDEISIPPVCEKCNQALRPDVVLFDEMLQTSAVEHLTQQWQKGFDCVFSIGTTSVFPYIAEPVLHCYQTGKLAIEINPSGSEVSQFCTYCLPLSATVALDAIWKRYLSRQPR